MHARVLQWEGGKRGKAEIVEKKAAVGE